jgi:predicted NUDIX family phosphoesterase
MVVPTADLEHFFGATFIRPQAEEILFLISTRHFFLDRDVAEVSPQYKQIIPYVIVRCGEDYFVLQRTSKQTESRLHHKVSLGIGGHINPGHTLLEGLEKELAEEVDVDTDFKLDFAGILNDDSTEVGRVHLGAVYLLEAATRDVRVRETEKMTGEWMPRAALAPLRERMETWSQIVYDQLIS